MPTKIFHYTTIAMGILEKILGSKFSVSGIENLPSQPILFVSNHFTRCETFFIPYILHKHTGRQVRCLADSGLYYGTLGKFLNSVGTISTKNPNRDNIILKDLITGSYDWMIYPEGSMMKSKETRDESGFVNYAPSRVGPVRTGSSVLALKSQIYRKNIIEAFKNNNTKILDNFKLSLDIKYQNHFDKINTHIVPVNITYYPIRPGKNTIEKLVSRIIKKIPSQIIEELEIEGNILLGSDINISFGDAINLDEYIQSKYKLIDRIPIIKDETKTNLIIKYFKYQLTNDFMTRIYSDVQINLDHIFGAALYFVKENEIKISHLKRIIYLSAFMVRKCGKYRIQRSILEENLFKIFLDEPHEEFDSIFELAKKQKLITEIGNGKISINKSMFDKKADFHEIRLENTLQVIMNEFLLLTKASNIVRKNAKIPDDQLRKKVFNELYKRDLEIFDLDYQIYFDKEFSKEKSIGSPFFLNSKKGIKSSIRNVGIIISHGYKSAPKEVEALAMFLNEFGFNVYATRLNGHGTAPINLKDITWQDWYYSMQRGYAALSNICSKILIIGFSTGGLLALLSSAKKNSQLAGIISINSALRLRDIKSHFVSGINIWNKILEKLHIEKGRLEYVDDHPENPNINYSRNYLKAVEQLEKLMVICEDNLKGISSPILIIQAKNDPVVNPISGTIIFDKIKSEKKFLSKLDFSNHVIINGSNKEKVFEEIANFLRQLKIL